MAGHVVVCVGLVKEFGSFRALDELNLEVFPGEVHGFLGPNGAGKSVTVRTLLGLLKPTAGRVTVLGKDPWSDAVELHHHMAYVPGDTYLWPNLTGGEILDYLARLRGGDNHQRREELIEHFQLDPSKKARTYSKGNRQKVALIAALASQASFFIFDEPTSGLDPLMEAVFQERVAEVTASGGSVLLSSHILGEVERVCERVTIIRNGATVETGRLEDLRGLSSTTINVTLSAAPGPLDDLRSHQFVNDVQVAGTAVTVNVEHSGIGFATSYLANLGIVSIESQPATLEELFMRHYDQELADSGVQR